MSDIYSLQKSVWYLQSVENSVWYLQSVVNSVCSITTYCRLVSNCLVSTAAPPNMHTMKNTVSDNYSLWKTSVLSTNTHCCLVSYCPASAATPLACTLYRIQCLIFTVCGKQHLFYHYILLFGVILSSVSSHSSRMHTMQTIVSDIYSLW